MSRHQFQTTGARPLFLVETLERRSLFSSAIAPLPAAMATASAVVNPLVVDTVATPTTNVAGGFYTQAMNVSLSTATAGASIYYTLDGSVPTFDVNDNVVNGAAYNGTSISVTTTTVIRSIARKAGLNDSIVGTSTYLYLADVIHQSASQPGYPTPALLVDSTHRINLDYGMDPAVVNDPAYASKIIPALLAIPTIAVSVPKEEIFGHGFYDTDGVEVGMSMEYFDPAHPAQNAQVNAGIEAHGDADVKRSLRINFKKIFGDGSPKLNLFKYAATNSATGAADADQFVLRAGSNRAWSVNSGSTSKTTFFEDEFVRGNQLAMSGDGLHGTYVHLYINGLYWGMYNLVERPTEGFGKNYYNATGDTDWYSMDNDQATKSGDRTRWNYLSKTLLNKDMSDPANYAEFKSYLDVDNFSDYLLGQFYAGVTDWPTNNWWLGGDTSKPMPFKYFSWDSEFQFNSSISSVAAPPNGAWVHPEFRKGVTSGQGFIAKFWYAAIESPEFRRTFADHAFKATQGALSDTQALARFDALSNSIKDAVIGESARWGDELTSLGLPRRTRDGDWTPAVSTMRSFLPGNANRLLNALKTEGYYPSISPATFSIPAGVVFAGTLLGLNSSSGAIYYTLNGSDPLKADGTLSSSAILYDSAHKISIDGLTTVRLRVKAGSEWSAINQATYAVKSGIGNLRLTEMMYHPKAPAGSTADPDKFEFVELKNTGNTPLDLTGVQFTQGITYTFGAVTVPAGGYVVLANDLPSFRALYGTGLNNILYGPYGDKLSNSSERVTLTAPGGIILADFTYQDSWYPTTDGDGYSMVVVDPLADPATLNNANAWRPSADIFGTPGSAEAAGNQAPVVSAGDDQTVTFGDTVTLDGSATDDGLPTGSALTSLWSVVSGPGTVVFADNATQPATTATFSALGTYQLRLTASDGVLSSTSDVFITVDNAINEPPVVSAGPDKHVHLEQTLTLSGAASDDGRPTANGLACLWTLVSGPGTVVFGDNATKPATTATFSAVGIYQLRLTASDGQFSTTSDVSITVDPTNLAPVVSAGSDQTLRIDQTATLAGTASDDGMPSGTLAELWTLVSGPGTVTFGDNTQPATTATFSATGTYVLRLTASDGELSTQRNVTIIVTPILPIDVPVLQGEDAALTNGTMSAHDNTGYTGAGYADFGGNGSAAAWIVNRSTAGSFTLTFRYANGSTTARPLTLTVNGQVIGALAFNKGTSWTNWLTVSATVPLIAGLNTVSLVAGPVGGPNVDSLSVAPAVVPPNTGSLSGFVFDDADGDGQYDVGEVKTVGTTVFLDTNNNGKLDGVEKSTTSAADGSWSFSGLAAGTVYHVRRVFPNGFTQSTTPIDATLAAGEARGGLFLGSKVIPTPPPGTGALSGSVFRDNNKNGLYDTGDGVGKGVIVFLDSIANDQLDGSEIRVASDANGKFVFTGLAAGTYRVRRVLSAGTVASPTPPTITLTAGQKVSNLRLGSKT